MSMVSALIAGPADACSRAAAAMAASAATAELAVGIVDNDDELMRRIADDDLALVILIRGDGDTAALPAFVAELQARQRDPLMALLIRSERPLPEAVGEELWRLGISDRHFCQPIEECAAAAALALRESARQRLYGAIAAAPQRLAQTASFRELATLALLILDEHAIPQRGALFCFERETSERQRLALVGTGVYRAANCTPIESITDAPTHSAIMRAWETRSNQFSATLAVLYAGTPSSRANAAVIALALAAPLAPWQKSLLESFVQVIAPVVEESQLAQQLLRTQRAMISTLATLAEYRDTDTGEHIARVARITAEVAAHLAQCGEGIDAALLEHIGHASVLHDIGKVAIPEGILLKPGALDADERAVISSHVVIGHEMLKKAAALATQSEARLFRLAAEIARSHHERFDGSGYPDGLAGDAIPLAARIVAVVDVFDALISQRPYKKPWKTDEALDLIRRESGRHFDPRIVDAFLAVHDRKARADYIRWSDDMSVGHDDLDRDHKRLIGILNHLGINLELRNDNIVEFILDDLADYARVHFEREERHLETIGFEELERHRAIHAHIARRIENARWKYFQGFANTLDSELFSFLTGWLNHHILVEDMKYSPADETRA